MSQPEPDDTFAQQTDLWENYARRRSTPPQQAPATMNWTWYGTGGPGAEVLGDVHGRQVLEIGCGTGRNLAHLTTVHGALGTGVDSSPAMHTLAVTNNEPRTGLRFVLDNATGYLRARPGQFDVIYSVFGAVDFTDPRLLLPAASRGLRAGGRLVFSTLQTNQHGDPPDNTPQPRRLHKAADIETARTMRRWVLVEQAWTQLLTEADLTVESLRHHQAPDREHPVSSLLITACRRR